MNVFVTGATGFVGRSLVLRLQRDGHRVIAWVRDPARARDQLGAEVDLVPVGDGTVALQRAVDAADAIINLAGEPVMKGRWNQARKRSLVESRVGVTRAISDAIRHSSAPPRVLLSASAVGYYGDSGDRSVVEDTAPADDFLARLCVDWEAAALEAQSSRTRVAVVRIGLVLGSDGGALEKMLPVFRAGFGGRLGSGRQYMPWIHMADLVDMFVTALDDDRYRGPINGVGPAPVSNAAFSKVLGRLLGRPAIVPAPAFALRLLLGPAADHVLVGQRAMPARLHGLGFRFRFPDLSSALRDIVEVGHDVSIERAGSSERVPDRPYLKQRPPRYRLYQRTVMDAPLDEVFEFFSKAENLGVITPSNLDFRIENERPIPMDAGTVIDYTIKLGPVPMKWRTVIDQWEPGVLFVDSQHRGPYTCWWHRHTFRADGAEGERTILEDEVLYTPPLGVLGRLANRLFIARMLRGIFGHRSKQVALRFGDTRRERARAA